MEGKRIVWLLGAGFSAPLGAPLFRDLISERTLNQLRRWPDFATQKTLIHAPADGNGNSFIHEIDAFQLAKIVCLLYSQGLGTENAGTRLWTDAEQFLDLLELAASEPKGMLADDVRGKLKLVAPQAGEGQPFTNALRAFQADDGLSQVHREAIRFVAGACSVFLKRAEDNPVLVHESEQWSPYRRWARKLSAGSDAVITFNYDRVLNVLNAFLQSSGSSRSKPLLDSPVGCDLDAFDEYVKRGSTIPMYHLHGHVGWTMAESDRVECGKEMDTGLRPDPAIAHREPARAVLGTPGKSKTGLPDGVLKDTWSRAMGAISDATSVIFVGYRFPVTDNAAKEQLADALRENPSAAVHIVLGANNEDMPRLKGMIEWTRDRNVNPVRVHEMWCQDSFCCL
jgi:hypothetical protein